MFSIKSIQPQSLQLVSCLKCGVKSDFKDRFCQKCGELLPEPSKETEQKTRNLKKEIVQNGPEYIGTIPIETEGGGFTIDPRTGKKKYNPKPPITKS
jgi:hypothetical protein